MNIDHRLHRAAHDLREIDIDVPPLAVSSTPRSGVGGRLGAPLATAATAALFVCGAVVAGSAVMPPTTAGGHATITADATVTAAPHATAAVEVRQLSALEEIAMISALGRRATPTARPVAVEASVPERAS